MLTGSSAENFRGIRELVEVHRLRAPEVFYGEDDAGKSNLRSAFASSDRLMGWQARGAAPVPAPMPPHPGRTRAIFPIPVLASDGTTCTSTG
ncbi:MAG TPA: hypothetical protein PKX25_14265, partial [Microthrixaceae bacterium]|nr:hypothetical protein [Microthrixaceae bacterium]